MTNDVADLVNEREVEFHGRVLGLGTWLVMSDHRLVVKGTLEYTSGEGEGSKLVRMISVHVGGRAVHPKISESAVQSHYGGSLRLFSFVLLVSTSWEAYAPGCIRQVVPYDGLQV